ncbi:YitT family protein [Marinomonas algicola]|uniref:YitT family protein n=1 Tax=Marinomonas algicola TaxID=2773454 RepID=UPI00174A759E|nr:YitT family protein [Marinomonas algicola]
MKTTHIWLSILEGCLLAALGLHILNSAGLLISGTAGVSFLLLQFVDLTFGQLFFLLNIPFYILAWQSLGWRFTLRTFLSVSLLSAISELLRLYVHIDMNPILSATFGGMLVGFGLIILFRHNASLGGLNILAVYLERKFNIHASKTTLVADLMVIAGAFSVLDGRGLAFSFLAFLVLSSIIGRYHKPVERVVNTIPQEV